jgi:hypothetical protein
MHSARTSQRSPGYLEARMWHASWRAAWVDRVEGIGAARARHLDREPTGFPAAGFATEMLREPAMGALRESGARIRPGREPGGTRLE